MLLPFSTTSPSSYVQATHVGDFGSWDEVPGFVCDLSAAIQNFGRVCLKDQQLLESKGYYKLFAETSAWDDWKKFYLELIKADDSGYPRVLLLIQVNQDDSDVDPNQAMLNRIVGWIDNPREPWVVFDKKTTEVLLGDKCSLILDEPDSHFRTKAFAKELVRREPIDPVRIGFKRVVDSLVDGTGHSVLPQARRFCFSPNSPSLGSRFDGIQNHCPWDRVLSNHERMTGVHAETKRLQDLIAAGKEAKSTPELFEKIGAPIHGQVQCQESEWLKDLATWTYITNVSNEFRMCVGHTTLCPFLQAALPANLVLSKEVADMYSHLAKPRRFQHGPLGVKLLEAAVKTIVNNPSWRPFAPRMDRDDLPSHLAIDAKESVARITHFKRVLQPEIRTLISADYAKRFSQHVDRALRAVEVGLVVTGLGVSILGCVQSNIALTSVGLVEMASGKLSLLSSLWELTREGVGAKYGECRTFLMTDSFSRTIGACYDSIWQSLYQPPV